MLWNSLSALRIIYGPAWSGQAGRACGRKKCSLCTTAPLYKATGASSGPLVFHVVTDTGELRQIHHGSSWETLLSLREDDKKINNLTSSLLKQCPTQDLPQKLFNFCPNYLLMNPKIQTNQMFLSFSLKSYHQKHCCVINRTVWEPFWEERLKE